MVVVASRNAAIAGVPLVRIASGASPTNAAASACMRWMSPAAQRTSIPKIAAFHPAKLGKGLAERRHTRLRRRIGCIDAH